MVFFINARDIYKLNIFEIEKYEKVWICFFNTVISRKMCDFETTKTIPPCAGLNID